jgi:hypothetical protein
MLSSKSNTGQRRSLSDKNEIMGINGKSDAIGL